VTGGQLAQLLQDAAESAERSAAPADPLAELAVRRRRRDTRRRHLVALAFVAFAVLLQLVPSEAFGASSPAGTRTVVASSTQGALPVPVTVVSRG
jgi:hypothetical protein